MAYSVLARKWRPQKFADVVGQDHIVRSLKNILTQDRVSHAYLLSGTRGIGKTTIARLFAKTLCCENRIECDPCLECDSCKSIDSDNSFNVLEMDGASNNGVDNIRQLIDNIQYLPTQGNYRVYIIDEVHMLSINAFNALLKTLEAPPKHVIFIFATTNPEKLPDTVLSRCQRFDFVTANLNTLGNFIKKIVKLEEIQFENEDQLKEICRLGNGSIRDTLSLLDQVLSYSLDNSITEDTLVTSLGLARTTAITEIIDAVFTCDVNKCSTTFNQMVAENVDIQNIVQSILDRLYSIIQSVNTDSSSKNSECVQKVTQAELFWIFETLAREFEWSIASIDPLKVSEIILQKVCLRRTFFSSGNKSKTIEVPSGDYTDQNPTTLVAPTPTTAPPVSKSWDNFLIFLNKKSKVMAAYLEQGNIIAPIKEETTKVVISLGFAHSAKVFLEYLTSETSRPKLILALSAFFSKPAEQIELNIKLLNDAAKKEHKFESKIEIAEKIKENLSLEKSNLLKNSPLIKSAESMFNSKADQVVLH